MYAWSQCFASSCVCCSSQRRRCGHNVLLVCKAVAAFVLDCRGILKVGFFSVLILGVTGWISLDHGLTVRCVDLGFVKVRESVDGGAIAVVGTWFSSVGTGIGGVTARLFFAAGGNGSLRVPVCFLFCLVGISLSVSSSASRGHCCWRPRRLWLFDTSGLSCTPMRCLLGLLVVVLAVAAVLGGVQIRGSSS